MSNTTLGKNIHEFPHGHPLTVYDESGQRNGVGKNCQSCRGISESTCRPHADISHRGRRRKSHTARNARKNIMMLCVTGYSACTYPGMALSGGGPAANDGRSARPRNMLMKNGPNEKKSGAAPKKKAKRKLRLFLRPNASDPQKP